MFSQPAGFHHGVDVPDCLKGLTFAEEALISIIQPAMAARFLKRGSTALKGFVTFFDRSADISNVASRLPRIAADVLVIELVKQVGNADNHVFREFKCRRLKVEAALR